MADQNSASSSRAKLARMHTLPLLRAIEQKDALREALLSVEGTLCVAGDASLISPVDVQEALESKVLESYESVRTSLQGAAEEVWEMEAVVEKIDKELDAIFEEVASIEEASSVLIGGTKRIHQKRMKLEKHLIEAEKFIEEYQLDRRDVEVLENPEAGHSFVDFREALERVKELSERCTGALKSGDLVEYPKALIEISEAVDSLLEGAYEVLCKWAIKLAETSSGSSDLLGALVILKERATLYATAIDEISRVRARNFGSEFNRALTVGGPRGVPKPIDLSAHNPSRYVNDMLARLHMEVTTERDVISLVLVGAEDVSDESATKILEAVTTSVCGPLTQRVRGAIYAHLDDESIEASGGRLNADSVAVLFAIAGLLFFYRSTFGKILGIGSVLTKTCDNLFTETGRAISKKLDSILEYIREEERSLQKLSQDDLSPPRFLDQVMSVVNAIVKEQNHSLLSMEEYDTILYSPSAVLRKFVAPSMQKITSLATKLEKGKGHVFMLNSFKELHGAIEGVKARTRDAEKRLIDLILELVQNDVQSQTKRLVEALSVDILIRCGLSHVLLLLQGGEEEANDDYTDALSQDVVSAALSHFYNTIPALELSLTLTHFIIGNELRSKVRREVLENIVSSYEKLFKFIQNPENGLSGSANMQIHSPQVVYYMLLH